MRIESNEDLKTLLDALNEKLLLLDWLDVNQDVDEYEYEHNQV